MMKRTVVLLAFFVLITTHVVSVDVETTFLIGNLSFADNRESSETTLPLIWPWGFRLAAHQIIDEQISINISLYDDPTLRYVIHTLLDYRLPFFSISVGPFFGLFNSQTTVLKPGITTALKAEIPNVAFVSFRADSSIGGRLVQAGDYLQERSDIAVGLYAPNLIASVNIVTKSLVMRTSDTEVVDSFSHYAFVTDLYQKNVPFRVLFEFGYQSRTKSFITVADRTATVHALQSIVLGFDFDFEFASWLIAELSLDSALFSFGNAGDEILSLPTSGIEQYLFNASLGFVIRVE